ncbi:flippase-like domain-containing protein [bacterium]|nr:flippase-like domain-containing protein [bacterium]
MKKARNNTIKLLIGLAISALFLYLAFGKIDFEKMKASFLEANFWYFIPAVGVILLSHLIRSFRLQYLLKSIKNVPVAELFSATMIGYMGNTILPAHLGELFRANVIGNRENISSSSVLATIVIERILDIFALLIIMAFALIVYPFPDYITKGGYVTFILVVGLFTFLVLLKKQNEKTMAFLRLFLKMLPMSIADRIECMIVSFIEGINGLERKMDYLVILFFSILIWSCYWLNFYLVCYAFDFPQIYGLNALSSVVLLVITTVSILVPSSPGYVGTYHYLCQITLGLFGVPMSVGLSYAFVAHALSTYPTALIGVVFAWKEGKERFQVEKE